MNITLYGKRKSVIKKNKNNKKRKKENLEYVIKDAETGRRPRMTQAGGKCNHEQPQKREQQGDSATDKKGYMTACI